MTINHKLENTTKTNAAHPSLGKALQGHPGTREAVENILDNLAIGNNSLSTHVKALNGIHRGSYRITIKQDNEYNEIQVRLYENTISKPIATGFIDRGHDRISKADSAEELRGLVRAYLCR